MRKKLLHDLSNKILVVDLNLRKTSLNPFDEVAAKKARNASQAAINILVALKKLEREEEEVA
jgi:hypothetical protein